MAKESVAIHEKEHAELMKMEAESKKKIESALEMINQKASEMDKAKQT